MLEKRTEFHAAAAFDHRELFAAARVDYIWPGTPSAREQTGELCGMGLEELESPGTHFYTGLLPVIQVQIRRPAETINTAA